MSLSRDDSGASPRGELKLPPNASLAKRVERELGRLGVAPSADLLEAFIRRCNNLHLAREDEQIKYRKTKLYSIRRSFDGSEYRLIYAQVKKIAAERDAEPTKIGLKVEPYVETRFVGLLPWGKKRNKIPKGHIETAASRLDVWLLEHPEFEAT